MPADYLRTIKSLTTLALCLFSLLQITGTRTSFDYSKSTFTCEGDGKVITYGFLSAKYQVYRPSPAYTRFLSSVTNFHGCVRRCCRLKWCKYALLSRRECYPSSCSERLCLYRKLRNNDAYSSPGYKAGFTTAVQGILKLDLHLSLFCFHCTVFINQRIRDTRYPWSTGSGVIIADLAKHNFSK